LILPDYGFFENTRQIGVYPQQLDPPLQESPPQETSFLPRSAASIMADAQPTPLSTKMACAGQFFMQAPHSIQFAGRANLALVSPTSNTPCGQTMLHIPQLIQASGSYTSVFIPR
jgi:hypothetical protein